jgi:hypothetical protein
MRTLITCLGMGMLVLSACGSSDSAKGTGTSTSTSVSTGIGTGVDTGPSTGTGTGTGITPQGNCANLTCMSDLVNLVSGCTPSGTCTSQTGLTGAAYCFSNGVKVSITMNMTTMAATETVKKGSSVCFSADVTGTNIVFKNGSGKVVATMNSTGSTMTCADGSTGTLDSTCGSDATSTASSANPTSFSDCTPGTCAL